MLLYELAISLDKRSPDLVDAAAALGLGELSPASEVTAEQVAALRAHFGAPGALPAPPIGAPAPAPAGGSGMWGPPVAPANWGPPTPPPPPPPPPGAVPAAPAPGHLGPQFSYEAAPLGPGAVPPPPPPPPPAWGAPVGPPPMGAPAPDAGRSGLSRGQMAAIGVVGVLVVGLFAFMVSNTGPDKKREQAIAADQKRLEDELDTATTDAPKTTTTRPAPATTAPKGVDDVVDLERFCRGGIAISTFELRIVAAEGDKDYGELAQLVRDRRSRWQSDVALMASGAAPMYKNEIARYEAAYDEFFDAVESSSSFTQLAGKIDRIEMLKAVNGANEFGTQISYLCK